MSKRNLSQKRILLTGASSGIGRALALELASRGCRLVLTSRRRDRLEDIQRQIKANNGECHCVDGDIASEETRKALQQAIATHWQGALDILINCAGIGAMGPFVDASPQRLRQIFEVNFFAPAELIRESYPALRRGDQPVVVNISSVLGHRAVPLKSEYCASKFALHGLSDALRSEFHSAGIDLLLISPSTTDSEFFDSAIEDTTGKHWKNRRAMSPERVAQIAARAIRLGKSEVILTWGGRALVWLDRLAPTWADYLITRFAK